MSSFIKDKQPIFKIKCRITNASNLTPQADRFFAKHKAQKSVQLAPLFMRSVMCRSGSAVEQLELYHLAVYIRCDVHH
jgi:hypothetical protein